MVKKNTEQLILDFEDRFHPIDGIQITREIRNIDKEYSLIWFIIKAIIYKEKTTYSSVGDETVVVSGESYTLDKAIIELTKNALSYRKPDISKRRIHIENHPYEGMENIVEYRKTN